MGERTIGESWESDPRIWRVEWSPESLKIGGDKETLSETMGVRGKRGGVRWWSVARLHWGRRRYQNPAKFVSGRVTT